MRRPQRQLLAMSLHTTVPPPLQGRTNGVDPDRVLRKMATSSLDGPGELRRKSAQEEGGAGEEGRGTRAGTATASGTGTGTGTEGGKEGEMEEGEDMTASGGQGMSCKIVTEGVEDGTLTLVGTAVTAEVENLCSTPGCSQCRRIQITMLLVALLGHSPQAMSGSTAPLLARRRALRCRQGRNRSHHPSRRKCL